MSAGGPNPVAILRQRARHVVALGLVLLVGVTVAGAALGGVTAAESQSSPIEISDWTDLDDIRNDTDADHVLVNDLNETTPGYETVAGPNANGGKGFAPIGEFNASFDGQGNRIANLTINRPNKNNVGVFGTTEPTVNITSVHIISMDITGSSGTGGLVGRHFGTIRNVSASGSVTGGNAVGGLVGRNFENATVWNASASGSVIGSFFSLGGLVGSNSGDSMIRESSARGSVTGQAQQMGGLVGNNFGNATIRESSAHGSVNGSDFVGGLVGTNDGTVSESFATGAVTGSSSVGGLVGRNSEGTVTGAYWDIQATGQSQSAGGIGLNTTQMQGASAAQNMEALDFTNTWQVVTNPPGYPELRGLSDGSDSDPLAPYTNSNNIVDIDGLLDAIDDWRGGEIGVDLLLDVLDAWRSGDPVT